MEIALMGSFLRTKGMERVNSIGKQVKPLLANGKMTGLMERDHTQKPAGNKVRSNSRKES